MKYLENFNKYKEGCLNIINSGKSMNFEDELNDNIALYQSMPIIHSTSIDYVQAILSEGICCYNKRGKKDFNGSSVFDSDIKMGLANYVFASIGKIPKYGSTQKRVGLLLDDNIICDDQSFFTFHDIAQLMNFCCNDKYELQMVRRILSQINQEKYPLKKIHEILAINSIVDFSKYGKRKLFPNAYDCDFVNINGGDPEIKIYDKVDSYNIIGFFIENNELMKDLEGYGIPSQIIFYVDHGKDEIQQLIEYKKNAIEYQCIKTRHNELFRK